METLAFDGAQLKSANTFSLRIYIEAHLYDSNFTLLCDLSLRCSCRLINIDCVCSKRFTWRQPKLFVVGKNLFNANERKISCGKNKFDAR